MPTQRPKTRKIDGVQYTAVVLLVNGRGSGGAGRAGRFSLISQGATVPSEVPEDKLDDDVVLAWIESSRLLREIPRT